MRQDSAHLFASLAAGMVIGSFAYGRLAAKFSPSALLRLVMIVSDRFTLPIGDSAANVVVRCAWVSLRACRGGRSTHCGIPSCRSVCSPSCKVACTGCKCRCCMPHHHLVNSSLAHALITFGLAANICCGDGDIWGSGVHLRCNSNHCASFRVATCLFTRKHKQ